MFFGTNIYNKPRYLPVEFFFPITTNASHLQPFYNLQFPKRYHPLYFSTKTFRTRGRQLIFSIIFLKLFLQLCIQNGMFLV